MQELSVSPYQNALMQNALAVFINIFSQGAVAVLLSWTDLVDLLFLGGFIFSIIIFLIQKSIDIQLEKPIYQKNELLKLLQNIFTRLFLFIFFVTLQFFVQIIKNQLNVIIPSWYIIMIYTSIVVSILLMSLLEEPVLDSVTIAINEYKRLHNKSSNSNISNNTPISNTYRATLMQNTLAVFIDIFSEATVNILTTWTDRLELVFIGGVIIAMLIMFMYKPIEGKLNTVRFKDNDLLKMLRSFLTRVFLFVFFIDLRFFVQITKNQIISLDFAGWYIIMVYIVIILIFLILALRDDSEDEIMIDNNTITKRIQKESITYKITVIQSTLSVFIDIFSQGTVSLLSAWTDRLELLFMAGIIACIIFMFIDKAVYTQLQKQRYKSNKVIDILHQASNRLYLFSFFITLRFFVLIIQNQIIIFSLPWFTVTSFASMAFTFLILAMLT